MLTVLTARLRERLGQWQELAKLTLPADLEKWLQTAASTKLCQRTFSDCSNIVRLYIAPALGSLRLDRITALAIQELVTKSREERGLTALTIRNAGVGSHDDLERAKKESNGLGVFIRSLGGLDREAAKEAFSQFLVGTTASANQIEFINQIVEYLTEHGVMEPGLLYESPFTDLNPHGPDGVFPSAAVDEMVAVLKGIHDNATAA